MDGILQVAVLLAALGGSPDSVRVPARMPVPAAAAAPVTGITIDVPAAAVTLSPSDRWTGEDKFRHAAASWAAMVFTFAAVRSVHDDADTALAVSVPVTAAFGVAKEIVDRRRGGPFSFRDLAADALGAGAAWLFLREVH